MKTNEGMSVITPTRDRPEAFALCVKWMMRQTIVDQIHWIVVDDGDVPVTGLPDGISLTYIRRPPSKSLCTLHDNLLAAIPEIKKNKVVIFEDDEHYSLNYLSEMDGLLNQADLVGESDAGYYHVGSRRWMIASMGRHASLCRTAFRSSLLLQFENVIRESRRDGDVFIDRRLWGRGAGKAPTKSKFLRPWTKISVGIKGMPGRGGLGKNHQRDLFPNSDPEMEVLRWWIGEDAKQYERFYTI